MLNTITPPRRFSPAPLRLLVSSALIAGLAACGGGGSNNDTASDRSLTGTVTSFDNAQSFSVDGIPVDASGASTTPQGMTTGSQVEIHGEMVNGTLRATKIEFDDGDESDNDNPNPNELDGRVTAYDSPTSFSVDGIPVDASAAPRTLTVGMRVEVHGTMSSGVLVASSVKVEDGGTSGSDDSNDDSNDDDSNDDSADDDSCAVTSKSDCRDDDPSDDDQGDDDSDGNDDSDSGDDKH